MFLSYLTIMAEVVSLAQTAPGACCKLHLHRMLSAVELLCSLAF